MRIAFVKPDHGIAGGFERLISVLAPLLNERGIETLTRHPRMESRGDEWPFAIPPPDLEIGEFVRYMALMEATMRMPVPDADIVVSTSPPSFAVEHPRHLSLFYHHQRIFYDLAPVWVEAGFADADTHAQVASAVRRVDEAQLQWVDHFLAGSASVAARLEREHGFTENVSVFRSGLVNAHLWATPPGIGKHVLCVSRHEFPKRTELAIQAALLGRDPALIVGAGGRLGWVQGLAKRWRRMNREELASLSARQVWLHQHSYELPRAGRVGKVRFLSGVDDQRLAELYRTAMCVVAPAYEEDYGLTALEAMAASKPVVVCSDGGGLTEFVLDGETGFVCEPTGPAIAEAVARLRDNPDLAQRMGERGRERAAEYSWDRALDQFLGGVERVLS